MDDDNPSEIGPSEIGPRGMGPTEIGPSFDTFFASEFDAVLRSVALYAGNRDVALDATQEAFARALARWRTIGRYDRPGAWVRRVALRCVTRGRRRRATERRAIERLEVHTAAVTEPGADAGPQMVGPDITDVLRELPGRQRAVAIFRYVDDLEIDEIAHVLGIAPATVRVHLHRAHNRLAEVLAPEVPEHVR